MAAWKPKCLVFSGGGVRVLVYNMALKHLESSGMLSDVTEYWGTSAGALYAALLSLHGATAEKLHTTILATNFKEFQNLKVTNLLNIQSTWGVDDGVNLVSEVEKLFERMEPGSSAKVLADIPTLHTVVADITLRTTVVLSAKNYPTMRVVDAVRASMALPFYFQPFRCPIDGHLMVDGGLRANFPWDLLPAESVSKSLGFAIDKNEVTAPLSFQQYIFTMIHHDTSSRNTAIRNAFPTQILWFKTPPFPPWFSRFQTDDYTLVDAISEEGYKEWLIRCQDRVHSTFPPGMHEIPFHSVLPCTPVSICPVDHTTELSDTPLLPQEPASGHFRHQLPRIRQPFRRWSF